MSHARNEDGIPFDDTQHAETPEILALSTVLLEVATMLGNEVGSLARAALVDCEEALVSRIAILAGRVQGRIEEED